MAKKKKLSKKANGMGSFTKIKETNKGTYYRYQFTVPDNFDDNGKAIRKAVYGYGQEECRNKAETIINNYKTGMDKSEDQITVYDLGLLISDRLLNANKIKESSYLRRMETLKRLNGNGSKGSGSIGSIAVSKVTPLRIENYLNSNLNYSQSVLDKIYQMLKSIFAEGIKKKYILEDPMIDIEKPISKQKKIPVRSLSEEEQKKLIEVLLYEDINYSEEMLISMFTGMRMGEVLALQVRDINLKLKTVYIHRTVSKDINGNPYISETTKTENGERTIFVNDEVLSLFKSCIGDKDPEEWIFSKEGNIISVPNVYSQFRRILDKYNILMDHSIKKVDLHSLRHTYATRCIESGIQAKTLQHILGHANIQTTFDIYGDVFQKFESMELVKVNDYLSKNGITLNAPPEESRKQA